MTVCPQDAQRFREKQRRQWAWLEKMIMKEYRRGPPPPGSYVVTCATCREKAAPDDAGRASAWLGRHRGHDTWVAYSNGYKLRRALEDGYKPAN